MTWEPEQGPSGLRLLIRFPAAPELTRDPLLSFVTLRSVDRRPFRNRGLTEAERRELVGALDGRLALDWHEGAAARLRIGRLNALATHIRLRLPEAFEVHRRIIDWQRPHSPDGIPAAATGLGASSRRLMRWAMGSWGRMQLLNQLGGSRLAGLELDIRPAIGSAGFFVLRWPTTIDSSARSDRLLAAGQAIQRFWLTAARLGLGVQPNTATVCFAWYGETRARLDNEPRLQSAAQGLAAAFNRTLGVAASETVFLGRIGEALPRIPFHRSTRLALGSLVETDGREGAAQGAGAEG